jgi:hypothetical protein
LSYPPRFRTERLPIPPDLARAAVASPMQPHFAVQSATGHLVGAMRVSDAGDRVTSGVDPVTPPQRHLLYLVMDLAAAESAERRRLLSRAGLWP